VTEKDATHVTWRPGVPLDLGATVSRFTVSRDEPVNRYDGEFFQRVLELADGRLHLLRVRAVTSAKASQQGPGIRVDIQPAVQDRKDLTHLRKTLFHILAVDDDLAAFHRVARLDSLLCRAIRALPGLRLARVPTLFEALVTAVAAQQVNLAFSGPVRSYLVQALGRLRKMKFSGAKARTIIGLAQAYESGELDGVERLPTPGAIERLTRLKGIGPWTAETALLRGAGRLDAFPADDLAIRKIVTEYYGVGEDGKMSGEAVRKIAEKWGTFAPYAMTYLFHAKRKGLL
jgi:DNA-3-methyladenine glycosylase II